MFRRLDRGELTVTLSFDGRKIRARPGDSVAAALLASGIRRFRETPVSGERRGPFCMMGVCFDCLLTIDGIANRQGCMVQVVNGMVVERQEGARQISTVAEDTP